MLINILNLSKKLISLPSTKTNPSMLKKVLDEALKEVKEYTIEYFEKNKMPSALVYFGKSRPKRFKVILNGHLDVVEAKEDQYKPYEKNGRLYGRGAIDMKAAAACEILVFKELVKNVNYSLGLQLVTDEEIGGFNGTKYQIEKGVRADFVIAGEPTDFGVNNQAKGIIWVEIETKGTTGHGAYPWNGDNALWKLKKILDKIENQYPTPKKETWKTTINLAKIETNNETFNKIPDYAKAKLDIRYIPGDDKNVLKFLKSITKNQADLKVLLHEPSQFTNQNNPFIKTLKTIGKKNLNKPLKTIVKHGGSDIRHFNQVGCDGVTFGPIGAGLHSDNEYVDIKSLENYYLILKEFLFSCNKL